MGEQIGACLEADFANGIFQYTVEHRGLDGWCFATALLELRDGTQVACEANEFLDGSSHFVCPAF